MSLYVATMDAERCEWAAAGETERDALEALAAGYNASPYYGQDAHLPQMDADTLAEYFGARVVRLAAGECTRDGEQVNTTGESPRPTEEAEDR